MGGPANTTQFLSLHMNLKKEARPIPNNSDIMYFPEGVRKNLSK